MNNVIPGLENSEVGPFIRFLDSIRFPYASFVRLSDFAKRGIVSEFRSTRPAASFFSEEAPFVPPLEEDEGAPFVPRAEEEYNVGPDAYMYILPTSDNLFAPELPEAEPQFFEPPAVVRENAAAFEELATEISETQSEDNRRTFEVNQIIRMPFGPVPQGTEVAMQVRLRRTGWQGYVRRLSFSAIPGQPQSLPAYIRKLLKKEPGDVTTTKNRFAIQYSFPSDVKEQFFRTRDWPKRMELRVAGGQLTGWQWRSIMKQVLTFVARCYARALTVLGSAFNGQARNIVSQYLDDALAMQNTAARNRQLRGFVMSVRIRIDNATPEDEEQRAFWVSSQWGSTNSALANLRSTLQRLIEQYNIRVFELVHMECEIMATKQEAVKAVVAMGVAVGLGKSWVEVQDKYWIVSFRTFTQCALKSIAFIDMIFKKDRRLCTAGTWDYMVELVSVRTRSLMAQLEARYPETAWNTAKRTQDNGSGLMPVEDLEKVAQFLGVTIKVFNHVFRKLYEFSYGSTVYETMIIGEHMVACIPIRVAENMERCVRMVLYDQTFKTIGGDKKLNVLTTIGHEISEQAKEDKPFGSLKQKPFSGPRIVENWRKRGIAVSDKPAIADKLLKSSRAYLSQQWVYGTYDFETYVLADGQLKAYCGGYYIRDPEREEENAREPEPEDITTFWGPDCAKRILEDIHTQFFPEGFEDIVEEDSDEDPRYRVCLYAHNGGRFDVFILLTDALRNNPDCPWELTERAMVVQDQTVVCLDMVSKTDARFQLRFLDSMRLVPGSLGDLTGSKGFNVKHQKMKDAFRHSDVDEAWIANQSNRDLCDEYLRHDILGLYEIIHVFRSLMKEMYDVELAQCITAASLSKAIFLQNFYDPKFPLFNLPKHVDEVIREYYFGGRCEVGYQGYVRKVDEEGDGPCGPIFALDVTSFYPYCMTLDLPYGMCVRMKCGNALLKLVADGQFFGYLRVLVKTTNRQTIPLHGIRLNGKLVFPHFDDWTELTLFSEEYYAGVKEHQGYEYKVLEGFRFERGAFLREFSTKLFQQRATAKAEGKKALSLILKLILNSGYGYFAFRASGKSSVEVHNKNTFQHVHYMLQGVLRDFAPFSGDAMLLTVEKDIDVNNYNIAVGAAIPSYARTGLWRCEKFVRSKPGMHVFYKDTDCIHTNMDPNLAQNHDWLRTFAPDAFALDGTVDATSMGTMLGSFKSECNEFKPYEKSKVIIGFDRAIYLAPKLYFLEKTLPNGFVQFKGASKGFSRKKPYYYEGDGRLFNYDGEHVGDWDAEKKAFLDKTTKETLVFNEFLVNRNQEELDLKTLMPVLDSYNRPKHRGPPSWSDAEAMLRGETIDRSMTSLALPFKTVMDLEQPSMLQERELRRTVKVYDEEGKSRYGKGTVIESGFVEPLVVNDKNMSLVKAFVEETPEEAALKDVLLMPIERSTNEAILVRLQKWYDMFADKEEEEETLFDEEDARDVREHPFEEDSGEVSDLEEES